jgi:hypothetical protein
MRVEKEKFDNALKKLLKGKGGWRGDIAMGSRYWNRGAEVRWVPHPLTFKGAGVDASISGVPCSNRFSTIADRGKAAKTIPHRSPANYL